MKKLKLLIPLLIVCCGTYSQSIEVNRADLIRVLKRVESLTVDSVTMELYRGQVNALNERIGAKDKTIQALDISLENQRAQIRTYETISGNKDLIIRKWEQNYEGLQKAYFKQRGKTKVVALAGVIGMGALTYLLIK